MTEARVRQLLALFVAVVVCVLVVQSPLIFNPGYLSHDELQWGYYAARATGGFFGNGQWNDVHAFQYRPLTFSLWIEISRRWFEQPYVFHAVVVGWGAINAGMLAVLLRRCGAGAPAAIFGALVFALGPYAAYTHGWVATIADLVWVSCALLMMLCVHDARRLSAVWVASFAFTAIALLAKESAIVMPALLALVWWFSGRQRHWAYACVASAVPVAIYLTIRLNTILLAPSTAGTIYQWSFLSIPARWAQYQLFPGMVSRLGAGDFVHKTLADRQIQIAIVGWLVLAWALWRANARWLAAFVLAGAAALGPVLILAEAANQYGYGFAAVTAGVCALAWAEMPRAARIGTVMMGLLCVWHGAVIMRSTHDIGVKQAHFSPALAQAISASDKPVRIRPQDERDRWIYLRLTRDIPSYQGVSIGDRVLLVAVTEPSDYLIGQHGELLPTGR